MRLLITACVTIHIHMRLNHKGRSEMLQSSVVFLVLLVTVGINCDDGSYLHDSAHVHDAQHIREHMKDYMDDADELKLDDTEAMEFHYFKLHDYDGNNKLDGLELGGAMTHYHDNEDDDKEQKAHSINISDEELSSLIDSILKEDDLNSDGYIDYYEFVQAQRRNRGEA